MALAVTSAATAAALASDFFIAEHREPSNSTRMNCALLAQDTWRAACEIQNAPGKRARHLARMAKCRWHPEPMDIVQLGEGPLKGPDSRNQQALGRVQYTPPLSSYVREACEVYEADGAVPAVWVFIRVGPFATRGGYTWSRLLALFPMNGTIGRLTGTTSGGTVHIADHLAGNADTTGDLFPYTPTAHTTAVHTAPSTGSRCHSAH